MMTEASYSSKQEINTSNEVSVMQNNQKTSLHKEEQLTSFSSWIYCICIVNFDLELGQAIEAIYPDYVDLSEQEKTSICYLAFPDSNSGCMGDTQYHVRIRKSANRSKTENLSQPMKAYDKKCPMFLQTDKDYFWGYVYFRQVRDKNLPRGYFQKSVVIVTHLPFVNLYTELCALITPEFFDGGKLCMERVIKEISNWPIPTPGQVLHLPLLGVLFQTYIPNAYKSPVPTVAASDCAPIKAARSLLVVSPHEGNMFRSLNSIVAHVHLLWELVLLSEPIVVMASSPTICSDVVHTLTLMISPLKYCADHRPYFTIHDSEFKEYTADSQSPPAVILGVTNPFFAKTLRHWPHVIRISDECTSGVGSPKYKSKRSDSLKLSDSKPGLYSQYKPYLQKDKVIIKKLLKGIQTKRPEEVQTALLKRHLSELTESFMIPLERYIASLMPLQRSISPFKATPIPQLFNPDEFIKTLSISGPQLTSGIKGDWVGLYKRFFRSPNFSGWFQSRYTDLTQKLQAIQLEALSQADLMSWVTDKQEVEVVDMILRIRQKLEKSFLEDVPIEHCVQEMLRIRINEITQTLPEDLRVILNKNSEDS